MFSPLIVILVRFTGPAVTFTWAAIVPRKRLDVVTRPLVGTAMTTWDELPEEMPCRVSGLEIVTCS